MTYALSLTILSSQTPARPNRTNMYIYTYRFVLIHTYSYAHTHTYIYLPIYICLSVYPSNELSLYIFYIAPARCL